MFNSISEEFDSEIVISGTLMMRSFHTEPWNLASERNLRKSLAANGKSDSWVKLKSIYQ